MSFFFIPGGAFAAEEAVLEVFCVRGAVTLNASAAPAREIFSALHDECGLKLRGSDLIPDVTVSAALRAAPMDDALEELVRLSGIRSTLRATSSSGALTLFILPGGQEGADQGAASDSPVGNLVRKSAGNKGALHGAGDSGANGAENPDTATSVQQGWEESLERLRRIDPDEAWVLERLDPDIYAAARQKAAAEEARLQFLLGATEKERAGAMADLRRLDPEEAEDLAAWGPEERAGLREEAAVEDTRRRFLTAADDGERGRALRDLRRLDPDEARFLGDLSSGALEDERREAEREIALRDYLLAISPEERQEAYEKTLRRDRE